MIRVETVAQVLEPISDVKIKLQRRLEIVPTDNDFTPEDKGLCKAVLLMLPDEVAELLDEEVLSPKIEAKTDQALKNALLRFGNNLYSFGRDSEGYIISGAGDVKLTSTMLMNATKYGCAFQVFSENGWTLTIPRTLSLNNPPPTAAASPPILAL